MSSYNFGDKSDQGTRDTPKAYLLAAARYVET